MILQPILDKWESNQDLVTLAGPLYTGEIPEIDVTGQKLKLPYTYMIIGSSDYSYMMAQNYLEMNEVTFYHFNTGAHLASTVLDSIYTVFAWQKLDFPSANDSTFSIRPLTKKVTCEHVRDQDGVSIYRGLISFLFTTNRLDT